jgi:hypothetical protein
MNQDAVGVSTVPRAELSGVISVSTAGQRHSSILLVLPLSVQYDEEGRPMVESQAADGLERGAENFETVTAACIFTPESAIRSRSGVVWRRVDRMNPPQATRLRPVVRRVSPAVSTADWPRDVGRSPHEMLIPGNVMDACFTGVRIKVQFFGRAAAENFPRGTRFQSCHLILRWIEP